MSDDETLEAMLRLMRDFPARPKYIIASPIYFAAYRKMRWTGRQLLRTGKSMRARRRHVSAIQRR